MMCTMVRQRKLHSSRRELGTASEMGDVSKGKVLGATKQLNEFWILLEVGEALWWT